MSDKKYCLQLAECEGDMELVANLQATEEGKALDATMGKVLDDKITALEGGSITSLSVSAIPTEGTMLIVNPNGGDAYPIPINEPLSSGSSKWLHIMLVPFTGMKKPLGFMSLGTTDSNFVIVGQRQARKCTYSSVETIYVEALFKNNSGSSITITPSLFCGTILYE